MGTREAQGTRQNRMLSSGPAGLVHVAGRDDRISAASPDESESGEIVFEANSCTICVQKTHLVVCQSSYGDRMRTTPRILPRSAHTPRFRHGRGRSQPQRPGKAVYETHDVREQASKENRASLQLSFRHEPNKPHPLWERLVTTGG